jgi:serine/threonine protein kinase
VRHSIHRDIKPENILLNSKGDVKITDFGVSKCIENSTCRSVVGTITYMSPERLSLDQQSYTYKCDIWSLGLILFELATGRPIPYAEHKTGKINYFKVSEKILKDPPPELPPNQFSPDFCDFLRQWYHFIHAVCSKTKRKGLLPPPC